MKTQPKPGLSRNLIVTLAALIGAALALALTCSGCAVQADLAAAAEPEPDVVLEGTHLFAARPTGWDDGWIWIELTYPPDTKPTYAFVDPEGSMVWIRPGPEADWTIYVSARFAKPVVTVRDLPAVAPLDLYYHVTEVAP